MFRNLEVYHYHYDHLTNNVLQNSTFLSDITAHLNNFNLELQGKYGTIIQLLSSINSFKLTLELLKSKLKEINLNNFLNAFNLLFENQHFKVSVLSMEIYCCELKKFKINLRDNFKLLKNIAEYYIFVFYFL